MRWMRYVQVAFGSLFGLVTLFLLVVAIIRFDPAHPGRLALPFLFGLPGAFVVGMLELQYRSFRNKNRHVREAIERCAARVFDAPGTVRPEYDMTVTNTPGAAAMAGFVDGRGGYTAQGEHRGVRVSVGSHASVAGRQLGEFNHVYSHVCVDVLGSNEPFFMTKQGVFGSVAKAVGVVKDVPIGDAAFDAAWIIHADQALARDVLDASIRARLTDLASKVSLVSNNFAQGVMSVLLTRHGLAIRWPGEMSPELAIFMRDLLVDMRTRLLAHLDRRAHAGMGQGYRVAAEDAAASAPNAEEDAGADGAAGRMARG